MLNKVGCLDSGDLAQTPRGFLKAKSYYVDKTQPMQGVVRHAKEENKIKTGDKCFGPHLTQQSAQVDHWALWGNKAREAMLGSKFYFSSNFYTFIIIFIIDLYFLKSIVTQKKIKKSIVTQLTLISVFCKGNIPFFLTFLFLTRVIVKCQESCIYNYSPGLCSFKKPDYSP